jgi:hypothetical protein
MIFTPENVEVVVGSVLWVDATAGMTMTSATITDYFPPETQPEQGISRQIIGTMRVNGEEEFPFDLLVVDLDMPGSGQDSVILTVGDDARTGVNATPASGYGFTYRATGPVVSGDIQELHLDIDPQEG